MPESQNQGHIGSLFWVVLVGLILLFNLYLLPKGTNWEPPLDLKFSYGLSEARSVLAEMDTNTLASYKFGLLVTDMIYPLVYGSFLGLILYRVWNLKAILVLPLLLVGMDVAENISIVQLVDSFPHLTPDDVSRASSFSSLKWATLTVILTMLGVGLVRNRLIGRAKPKPGI